LIFIFTGFISACHPSKKLSRSKNIGEVHDSTSKTEMKNDIFLSNLLKSYPQYFDSLLADQKEYGVQIIYTEIDRGRNNIPKFTDHYFNVNTDQFFYPASTVKFPVALLTLQKINELGIKGLDKNTTMITEAGYSGQSAVYNDPISSDGRPSVAQYIKKIFLVSDNDAFNRLYEFLGQEYINNALHDMGYTDVQIIHRLSIFLTEDENRHSNPINFFDGSGHLIYGKPVQNSRFIYAIRNDKKGKGYYAGDKLINEPFDFSKKNRLSLSDLHTILKSVFFPNKLHRDQRFNLTKEDYNFVYKYMSMFPRESDYPFYDSTYQDAYSRFLLWGETKEKQSGNIRIFHKSGEAYGFLTDVAYVVDFDNQIEFMLSATIHCNKDGIYNDDKYDYETVGFPFLKHLGQIIYDYEIKRQRKHKPDLSSLKFDYTK
jgi:hypothetical protein